MKESGNGPVKAGDISLNPASPQGFKTQQTSTLRACVSSVMLDYLTMVDASMVNNLYAIVLTEVEAPLLEAVMLKARSNQSKAAHMLGINRGTLRTLLKKYKMLD